MTEFVLACAVAACVRPDRRSEPANGVLFLRERKANMKIEIVGLPEKAVAIHVEKVGHLPGIQKGCHLERICDYLLIADCAGKPHAVFVELKKTLDERERPKQQLIRSTPILEYLRCMCSIERGIFPKTLPVVVHYWIIAEKNSKRLDKQPTKSGRKERTKSDSYMNIHINMFVGTRIRFKGLIGG